ncbi:MAG: 8-oxo-dGTP diphosphatase [Clostridia bacterium]|nr:8-oxo-dGTP diphosphatase [Clostridia bacterium]
MRATTLCYIERGNEYLMLHRTKKVGDANHDKWLGIGGGIEPNETPDACLLRECLEETGLTLTSYKARGIVHFRSDKWEDEEMYLYTADGFTGDIRVCDEGDLEWIDKDRLYDLTLWAGDRIFLERIRTDCPYFDLTLNYRGETLVSAVMDGVALPL